jgi:hypothetical protein
MARRKYLLDENVNPRLRKALKQLSPDMIVWRVGDVGVPPRGTSDPGIFILKDGMSLPETVEELTLIWEATEPGEYADLLNFLPVSE